MALMLRSRCTEKNSIPILTSAIRYRKFKQEYKRYNLRENLIAHTDYSTIFHQLTDAAHLSLFRLHKCNST